MDRHAGSKMNMQIYEEACAWFVESRAGLQDEAGRRDFDRWLRKSPEHLSAYLEIAAIWNEGPSLDPDSKWSADTLIQQALDAGDDNVVPLPGATASATNTPDAAVASAGSALAARPTNVASAPTDVRSGRARSNTMGGRVRPWRRLMIAASIAVLAILGGTLALLLEVSAPTYATALGEQRSIEFADGSTVELNSRSKIRVKYSKRERDIELLEGQALFHVAHDTSRPFIVSVGTTRVRAVGTQFDVYKKSNGTVVTVVEGRVAVYSTPQRPSPGSGPIAELQHPFAQDSSAASASPSGSALPLPRRPSVPASPASSAGEIPASHALPDNPSGSAVLLAAGEQLTVTPEAAQKALTPNIAGATAWRERQIVFESASLSDVAEEFNRYNERQLVIQDPQALTFHVSGVFSSTDPDSLIRFLKQRPGVKVTETGSRFLIERASP
jgi:transmembrane sensor